MVPATPGYPAAPSEAKPFKPQAPSPRSMQPRILIPTPGPLPKADAYQESKLAQQDYPYVAPVSGRYLYPDPMSAPPARPTIYRRPAVQRYVDPHTMKAYDVVPADDYPEPSAPPQSLLPSHDYHVRQHRGEPVYVIHFFCP